MFLSENNTICVAQRCDIVLVQLHGIVLVHKMDVVGLGSLPSAAHCVYTIVCLGLWLCVRQA